MTVELDERQRDMLERVRRLGEVWLPHVQEWDRTSSAPLADMLAQAADEGLLGMTVPTSYGGLGWSILDYSLCVEEICRVTHSWLTAEVFFRTSGPGPAIILAASEEACRSKFLPDIVAGTKTCAIALTEPLYGSALTDIETTAIDDGDAYVLNGSKRFVTGAPEDDLYATFVRFGEAPGASGIGALIVEKGMDGLTLEEGVEVMGARGCPHGNLIFDNCRVPKDNVVVTAGHFKELMLAFNVERMHNSALSVGLAQGAWDLARDYAMNRYQFGRPIVDFQSVYHSLADMYIQIEAARQLVYRAAETAIDGRFPRALEVSTAKVMANQVGRDVIWQSMQIHGGDGVTKDYLVEQSYRDVLAASYGGGTAAISKNVIASMILDRRFDQRPADRQR